jgi:hypothetical protein
LHKLKVPTFYLCDSGWKLYLVCEHVNPGVAATIFLH